MLFLALVSASTRKQGATSWDLLDQPSDTPRHRCVLASRECPLSLGIWMAAAVRVMIDRGHRRFSLIVPTWPDTHDHRQSKSREHARGRALAMSHSRSSAQSLGCLFPSSPPRLGNVEVRGEARLQPRLCDLDRRQSSTWRSLQLHLTRLRPCIKTCDMAGYSSDSDGGYTCG